MNGKRIEQKGRREKKKVWESRDGEAENEWLNMKMMIYFNRDEGEK